MLTNIKDNLGLAWLVAVAGMMFALMSADASHPWFFLASFMATASGVRYCHSRAEKHLYPALREQMDAVIRMEEELGSICWKQLRLCGTTHCRIAESIVRIGFQHAVKIQRSLYYDGRFKDANCIRYKAERIRDSLVRRGHPAVADMPAFEWADGIDP